MHSDPSHTTCPLAHPHACLSVCLPVCLQLSRNGSSSLDGMGVCTMPPAGGTKGVLQYLQARHNNSYSY